MIDVPARLAYRPRYKGIVVPFTVLWDNGVPDFRATDMDQWAKCVGMNLCGVCGQQLDYRMVFIGGPKSVDNRSFFDPAMHEECGRYALSVCPFLFGKKDYAKSQKEHPGYLVKTDESISDKRPDKFGLYFTRGFRPVVEQGALHLKADKPTRVEWFE